VSSWEIAVKRSIGKLRFDDSVEELVAQNGFLGLPVTIRHGDLLRDLPLHHADPFDRLLIVQAQEDGFTILSSDRAFEPYRVPVVWA
jgi:PIN domain nuclease of toxin-antitoxin system